MLVSRRWLTAGVGLSLVAPRALAAELTAAQMEGPFYPRARPADQDWDLTRLPGRSGRAAGQVIEVTGRVLDARDRPIPGAKLDLWQANSHGRYMHPGDGDDSGPLDPNFQGSAVITAGADGRYRFRTIKPAAYGARPPHIHFTISGRNRPLTTQMYFPGEPLNVRDGVLRGAGPEARTLLAVAGARTGDGALAYAWDVRLA